MKEESAFLITDEKIYCDILQLVYEILTSDDKNKIAKFEQLVPTTIDYIDPCIKKELLSKLHLVKVNSLNKYKYLTEIVPEEKLLVYCAKYICNAFSFDDKPAILLNGSILNHSCYPNLIFGKDKNFMVFQTVRNIKKGEEVCINYIDITLSKKDRQINLRKQYGFTCMCDRCREINKRKIDEYDLEAFEIEKHRLKLFGYTKSILSGGATL